MGRRLRPGKNGCMCAWCKGIFRVNVSCKNSHGICEQCKEKLKKEMQEYKTAA